MLSFEEDHDTPMMVPVSKGCPVCSPKCIHLDIIEDHVVANDTRVITVRRCANEALCSYVHAATLKALVNSK